MARTAFQWVVKSANFGNTPYVVPAAKVSIFNVFRIIPPMTTTGSDVFTVYPILNGTPCAQFAFTNDAQRYGPIVLAAGDTFASVAAGGTGPSQGSEVFGIMGFHYNPSNQKVPFNRQMFTSSSYTVPAGKYIVFNVYPAGDSMMITVTIDGVALASTGRMTVGASPNFGPYMARAGQTITIGPGMYAGIGSYFANGAWMTGFLYNQL